MTPVPKLALVTGGLKRIGAAIAARLAADGWSLALHCGHMIAPEAELAAVLVAQQTDWHIFEADLRDATAVAALLPAIVDHFDQLPALIVNNAALFRDDNATTVTAALLEEHYAINVIAPVQLACALALLLPDVARANVVNILDQRIAQPHGDQLSYTLSKQSLGCATRTLAQSLAPKIRVNAVAPGLTIATPDFSAEQLARLADLMPLQLLPAATEIADAVAYLAQAQSVTGQTIFVDGGAALRSFDRDFVYLGRD